MPARALQIIQPRSILAESHNATFGCAYNNTGEGPLEEFRISVHKGEIGLDTEIKRCGQFTQTTLIVLAFTAIFILYSVFITCLHWPLGTTACILRMKEAVDMKCELIHNSDEPATATWTGQRWETGPRQDVEKEPRRTKQ
ncbi:hypothetical protein scyTo_0002699 [Scyliorhinus torazame]|uniref:Uncharacterized protein n=1 Tax=Scyliorhinus torazame TaxID=75743 RepID=A0A401PKE9_SCYTO|nr:hypothetical protein [Scyliorhinus torazame]